MNRTLFEHPALTDFVRRHLRDDTELQPVSFTDEKRPILHTLSIMQGETVFPGLHLLYTESTTSSGRAGSGIQRVEIVICTEVPRFEERLGYTSLRHGLAILTLRLGQHVHGESRLTMTVHTEDHPKQIQEILTILKNFTDTVQQLTTS